MTLDNVNLSQDQSGAQITEEPDNPMSGLTLSSEFAQHTPFSIPLAVVPTPTDPPQPASINPTENITAPLGSTLNMTTPAESNERPTGTHPQVVVIGKSTFPTCHQRLR